MKKKGVWVGIALVLIFFGVEVYRYCSFRNGSTKEEQLQNLPSGKGWRIIVEQSLEDYLVCGIQSTDEKIGVAVFEPVGNGKYRLISREYRAKDEVIISGVSIAGRWYDLVWFNDAPTTYAELTYTYGGETETLTFDTAEFQVIYNLCEAKDYTLSAVYYDSDGKRYE